jgi:hypothetical protein
MAKFKVGDRVRVVGGPYAGHVTRVLSELIRLGDVEHDGSMPDDSMGYYLDLPTRDPEWEEWFEPESNLIHYRDDRNEKALDVEEWISRLYHAKEDA